MESLKRDMKWVFLFFDSLIVNFHLACFMNRGQGPKSYNFIKIYVHIHSLSLRTIVTVLMS